jgi:hypothetical protein
MKMTALNHVYDFVINADAAESIESSQFFMESEVALVDDGGFDCAGTVGCFGSAGGCLGTVGTFGCCC